MAVIPGLKLSEDGVTQTIDLADFLPETAASDPVIQEAFTQAVIDKITSRTADGKDAFGATFAGYSESYKDSLAFKAFGKSSKVDMELTGVMLASIDLVDQSGTKVQIGITNEAASRAYGHMTGMDGHPTLDGVTPKRKFFGVTKEDIAEIADALRPDLSTNSSDDARLMDILQARLLAGQLDVRPEGQGFDIAGLIDRINGDG